MDSGSRSPERRVSLAAGGQRDAAFGRRCIPAEPRRFAALIVALRSKYAGPVAVKMQPRRDAHSPDDVLARERRPVLPVGAFTPAPPRTAGRDGVLPSSRMAHVSAPTPPGRAARRPGNADLRSAPRGSAKPAPMTLRHANVSFPPSPNPACRDRSTPPLPGAAPFSCQAGCTGGPVHGQFSQWGSSLARLVSRAPRRPFR